MPSLVLRPGVQVRLKRQPAHLPDFLVMHCRSDRAWIRQPDWPTHVQLCVNVTQLAVPAPPTIKAAASRHSDSPNPTPIL